MLSMTYKKDGIIFAMFSHRGDKVEGCIFNIMKYSIHDGPGIRTTVFMKGCPLRCLWCHNPESQMYKPQLIRFSDRCIGCGSCAKVCSTGAIIIRESKIIYDMTKCTNCGQCAEVCYAGAMEMAGEYMNVEEVVKEIEKDKPFYEESGGGVTFSGGEPFMQPAFLKELLISCHRKDIHTAVDTSGFVQRDIIIELSKYIDLFLYDLKLMDNEKHKKYAGGSNEIILDNLKELINLGKRIFIRIPIIPGINDDDDNLEAIGRFLSGLRGIEQINVLPYHNIAMEKYKRLNKKYGLADLKAPSDERMKEIAQKLMTYGFKVKIGG